MVIEGMKTLVEYDQWHPEILTSAMGRRLPADPLNPQWVMDLDVAPWGP
jgi:hypothetical protein